MRITYCPRGHRVEVHGQEHGDPRAAPYAEYWLLTHTKCSDCVALIMQAKPFKAKRSGES